MSNEERTPLKETSPADTGGGSTAGASSFPMELSWLKLYISDVGMDLADLSMEERGAYVWIMLQQWKRGPMSEETVRFYAGKPFAEMSPSLRSFLAELAPGMFGLAWLEARRSVQIQRHKTNRENAKKGGRPKKKNRTVSEKEPNAKRPPSSSTDSFTEWWNLYERKGSKKLAADEWAKLSEADQAACLAGTPAYLLARSEKVYRKDGERFLRNRTWEDEIVASAPTNGRQEETVDGTPVSVFEKFRTDFHAKESRWPNSGDQLPKGYKKWQGWI